MPCFFKIQAHEDNEGIVTKYRNDEKEDDVEEQKKLNEEMVNNFALFLTMPTVQCLSEKHNASSVCYAYMLFLNSYLFFVYFCLLQIDDSQPDLCEDLSFYRAVDEMVKMKKKTPDRS